MDISKKGRIMGTILLALVVLGTGRFVHLGGQSQDMAPVGGLGQEQFKPCPKTPNCVSSFEKEDKYIKPIKTSYSLTKIKSIINNLDNTKLLKENDNYLHFSFSTSLFGFTDDVHLLLKDNQLHVQSASRVGHSDLGKNRSRIEKLRELLSK